MDEQRAWATLTHDEFRERVRETRIERGLTYTEVCEQTGVNRSVLHKVEHSSHYDPRLSTVIALMRWVTTPPLRSGDWNPRGGGLIP